MNIKSIRIQMLISLLVGLFALFGLLIYVVEKELNKLPDHLLMQYQEIASARAKEVEKEFEKFVQEVKLISQSPIIQSMDFQEIHNYLPKLVIPEQHRNMTIAKKDGSAWTTLGSYIDIREQEQYQKIMIEGLPYWISQPFISPFAHPTIPIIIFSHEVRKDEELVGLVNIVIDNNFLNDIVKHIKVGETGFVWIVDEAGNIVAHPDSSMGFHRHMKEILPNFEVKDIHQEKLGWSKLKTQEGTHLLTFFKEINGTQGWNLLLSIDNNEAMAEISSIRVKIILFLIFTIVLLSILAYYFALSISKPILDLKKVFEKAETGDLNVIANEAVRNEVGSAAKSFNKMLRQIKKLTYYDSLTNLYNLNGFLLDLPYRTKKLKEKYRYVAVVVVSIDDFKRINSISGYKGGNLVLQRLGYELLQFIDNEEGIGRYFGDEFILLLKETTMVNLESRIKQLWERCGTEMLINEHEFRLKVSIGVAVGSYSRIEVDEIVNRANIAKMQAKKQGGNRYQYYNNVINESIRIEQKVENALYHAIEKNELYLVYQPIVDLKSNTIIGTEALIRWKNDQFQHITPLKLIEIAEQKGLIVEIGKWVLHEALVQNKKWHDQGHTSLFVSVNISTIQFDQLNFVETVKSILAMTEMQPQFLELEVTETNAMTFVEEKLIKMSQLKEMGIRIAIDDFGTGYSSLAYFTRFPIHTLKIDRSFVNKINEEDNAKTIITTIINMAKTINIATTAEGVETVEQVKFLEEQGCDKIQGYLISKPVLHEQIEELLK